MKACKYKIFTIFSHGMKYNIFLKKSCIEYETLDLKLYLAMNCTRQQSNWMGKTVEAKIELCWKRSDYIYALASNWNLWKPKRKLLKIRRITHNSNHKICWNSWDCWKTRSFIKGDSNNKSHNRNSRLQIRKPMKQSQDVYQE
jgi:hypothetical protein